ncbi:MULTISPECIES: pantetheine-phosphate adenylyltransferase [unclassified Variovorax]|uniref:pantetheine-phosphate adenylyltransferase n=1 Tax=unclassified Variovorax TaxID=663243 RepID=UPI00076BD278|nr:MULTISPECIES: pantetheine-phosphate adenylyltransferase [unclassified Variovorax]KWT98081.1 Phosphopantetheine adenylyltransferase [Variovorax sp. WDL1]PNG50445.1 Phosphopantetheine adenylyltransferase [Variovorax sp. B2]PNG51318.1 Phosphopantetheine adenylyltransferase [Variovorax sp. B4]VTU43275.1 Phosphopantetheine adenylyltransferase [Variovorax sp. PBL-H6]VTU43323.1 Phosphopantetheine adenylyltransferase [Variovorax sp. SRS16]
MTRIAVYAGTFDPLTKGHLWVIREALRLTDKLYVAIGVNPDKKTYFSLTERLELIRAVLSSKLTPADYARIEVVSYESELLVNFAGRVGATHIIRGIRNSNDFHYEFGINQFNRTIDPRIETIFLITPDRLAQTSSSFVKGLVGVGDWETLLTRMAHPAVIAAFKAKRAATA